jgi:predicted metalloprotease with PDZ domain
VIAFDVRGPPAWPGTAWALTARTSPTLKVIDAAARLMGDVPYTHYAFLLIGRAGRTGAPQPTALWRRLTRSTRGYIRWLAFVSRYFHLFNAAHPPDRSRPFATIGGYTRMLWVSRFTVYYADLLLNRAGL